MKSGHYSVGYKTTYILRGKIMGYCLRYDVVRRNVFSGSIIKNYKYLETLSSHLASTAKYCVQLSNLYKLDLNFNLSYRRHRNALSMSL